MIKQKLVSKSVSLLLAVLFALVYYAFTTPLGPSIGSDNAIYMTMGTAIANGYAPYTEIFDHKGPLLFVLQAIPQLISGGYSTLAIFGQQVVFLFACLCLLERISKELHAPGILVQLIYLALIAANVDGGNLTEEYTNVFTLVGLMMILCTFAEGLPQTDKKVFVRASVLGATNMLCFLTRANNVLVLCAMTLMIAIWMLLSRRMDLLIRCVSGFVLGMAACALPVILWLVTRGALKEAIYGSIVHNMMYAETGETSRVHMLLYSEYGHWAMLQAVLSVLGAAVIMKKSLGLAIAMAAGAAAAGFAAFVSHKFYQHYLLMGAPLAAVGAAVVFAAVRMHGGRVYRLFAVALALVCVVYLGVQGVKTNRWRVSECEGMDLFTQQAKEIYSMVPEEDRDSFLAYRVEPKWYVATKALPCMRFYFLQEILADADPAVMDEIVETFHIDAPRWVVLFYNRPFSPPYDARVQEIFDTRYEFVDAKGEYQLLKLREEP